jgi:glucokinase
MVAQDRKRGRTLREIAGSVEAISAATVARGAALGDPLSLAVIDHAARALIAGCVGLVNAFNPCRLILGGGVIDGMPALIDRVREGVMHNALPAATVGLEVIPGALGSNAGMIGAACLALKTFGPKRFP